MKAAIFFTACLLAFCGAQQTIPLVERLRECICEYLEDVLPSLVNVLSERIQRLCAFLEATISADDPAYERIVHFKTWILMKLDMIEGMIFKGKSIKDRFPDICELAQFLKFYLCVLLQWLHELRCEIRELDCFLVYRFGFKYVLPIGSILDAMDQMDLVLLRITKCFKVFYYSTHCENTWNGRKAGKGMGPFNMISKEEGDIILVGKAFDLLDEDMVKGVVNDIKIADEAISGALEADPDLSGDVNATEAANHLVGVVDQVKELAEEIVSVEERTTGNICSYTVEYRDFLCDLMEKNQLFRKKIRLLEIVLKFKLGPAYKFSRFKRYIDRLYYYFYKLDYYTLKIGLLYIDFFIRVHCDFNDCWCVVRGDPMVLTCDKALLFLQGAGWYPLAIANGAAGCKRFFVYIKVEMVNGIPLPVKMVIYFRQGFNDWYKIEILEDHVVFLDGNQVLNFPLVVAGALKLEGVGTEFSFVNIDCGYIAFWYEHPLSRGKVHIDNAYYGRLRGLCGDYDGVKADDLQLANGTASDDFADISGSFRLDSLPALPTN